MEKLSTVWKNIKTGKVRLQHWHVIACYLMLYDLLVVNLAYFAALLFRFDGRFTMIPNDYLHSWMKFAPVYSSQSVSASLLEKNADPLFFALWYFGICGFIRACGGLPAMTSL